jgi:hypothetical protein
VVRPRLLTLIPSGGLVPLIPGLAIGDEFHDESREPAEQKNVNQPAFVKQECQDKPDYQNARANQPQHLNPLTLQKI